MKEFDVVIIGGGPGGYVAAIRAAQGGASVAVVEKDNLGGTCLNRGCIPTKALYYSAKAVSAVKKASEFGVNTGEVSFDITKAMARKDEVVTKLVKGIGQLFKGNGVELIKGKGIVTTPNKVKVIGEDGETEITAKSIIIATGSEPALIPAFNIDGEKVITSTEALNLKEVPESMLIIGAGVMGCEFATVYAKFGTKVTMVELMPEILQTEDKQIVRVVTKAFKELGVDIHLSVTVKSVETKDGGVVTTLEDGTSFETEKVLVSIGRSFNTSGIGLEDVGVEMERGKIKVNDKMETNVNGIYAIGDVTGEWLLAHVASVEGEVAVANILGKDKKMDYSCIPAGIFTDPEIASVGLKEEEAKEQGIEGSVGRFPYAGSGKALGMGESDGFVQVVADPKTDKVLGASIVGAHATDLIGELALAMRHGITVKEVTETVHAHPTLPEVVLEACEDVHGAAVHKVGRKRR